MGQLLALAIIVCVFLALVVNIHYGINIVYTHLFYIPIVMAGVWYHRWALLIAGGLGAVHISCDYVVNHGLTSSSLLRTGMFLGVALVVGLLSEKRDILYQELQKINNAIKETEFKYKTVAEYAYDWETWEDETGKLKYISFACERTSGYTAKEFLENDSGFVSFFASLIVEEDQEKWAKHRHDIDVDKGIHSEQFRIRNKNGKIVWIEHTCRPITAANGMYLGYRANNRDITERKQAEEQLLKSEERYRTIFENARDAIFAIDIESRHILDANKQACQLVGYAHEELMGKMVFELHPSEIREVILKDFSDRVMKIKSDLFETVVLNRDGKIIPVEISVGETYHIGDRQVITGFIRDITERKQAEGKLRETNEKLFGLITELKETTSEMSQMGEMGEQLQSCQTIAEAFAISAQYTQELFPTSQGALYLIGPATNMAEAVEMWGASTSTEKMFAPSDCWAVRRGRPHLIDDSHPGLLCGHITGSPGGQYLCVPMIVHGESIGILYLNYPVPELDQQKSTYRLFSEHKTQLALTVADHIALAVNNLRLQEELRQQAIRDILTGLFNRRYMEESLRRELKQAARTGTSVGVIMFDIDHFKDFNDLLGHDGGDALLRELGGFLNTHTRGGDIVSRYGGEEFVSVFPGATLEDSRVRAEELRLGVKELAAFHLGKPLSTCTISLGVAAFPERGLTSDEILKSADTALYCAKNEGGNRVVVASIPSQQSTL